MHLVERGGEAEAREVEPEGHRGVAQRRQHLENRGLHALVQVDAELPKFRYKFGNISQNLSEAL